MTRTASPAGLDRPGSDPQGSGRISASEGTSRVAIVLVAVLCIGVLVPLVSSVFDLYDRIEHWGKLVHALDGACATFIFGMLLFGWRDLTQTDLTDELATLLTMCFGILFGVVWEIVEFAFDWVFYSDLQKSNTDTMTDFLWNNLAVILAAQIAVRVYSHHTSSADRARLGRLAAWLVDGPSRMLDRHGLALATLTAALIAVTVAALWFSGRPLPGLPIP